MQDRSWMLNRSALSEAKNCVQHVRDILGIKLKLSHPDFMVLISEYCEMTESEDLISAYQALKKYAEPQAKNNVVSIVNGTKDKSNNQAGDVHQIEDGEYVDFKGKQYLKFDAAGKEFQGLYRGAARYA